MACLPGPRLPVLGETLSHVAVLVALQLSVPPPMLLMNVDLRDGQFRVDPYLGGTHSANPHCVTSIVGDAVTLPVAREGLVGVSDEQAAMRSAVS